MQRVPPIHFSRLLPRGWSCPDEQSVAAYADGRTSDREKRWMEEHLAGCEACRAQVAFLVRSESAEGSPLPAGLLRRAQQIVSGGQNPAAAPGWSWAAAAATAAAGAVLWMSWPVVQKQQPVPSAVGPAISVAQQRAPAPPAPQGREETTAVRSTRNKADLPILLSPQPDSSLHNQREFRWLPVAGALYYEVRVVTADGDVVWEQRTEGTSIRLPEEVRLRAREKYFVWLRAYLPEGKVRQSKAVAFFAG